MTKFTINGREVQEYWWQRSNEKGIHKGYYENGQIGIEISYLNKQQHGLVSRWNKDGLLCERYFKLYRCLYYSLPKLSQLVHFGKVLWEGGE